MADAWTALQSFWSSFGWAAYDEQTVFPDGAQPAFPHITYEAGDGDFGHETFLVAHLWDRSTDWQRLKQKAAEIKAYLKDGGVKINVEDGQLWFKLVDTMTFSQPIESGSDDPAVKRILINLTVEYLTV